MDHLKISPGILRKLSFKHSVTREEVEQCFVNRYGRLLMDTRATADWHSTLKRKNMVTTSKIESTAEAWDSRELGASAAYVAIADAAHEQALDKAMELQSISIRLPKQLIEQYKLISHFHGIGYQPLMRDILTRFVPNALQEIMQTQMEKAIEAVASKHVASKKKSSIKPAVRRSHTRVAQAAVVK